MTQSKSALKPMILNECKASKRVILRALAVDMFNGLGC